MAVAEINAKGGVLGRQLELLPRDSKANADEAVRLSRELIIKDNVDFLAGTLTSAEAPAVSTVAKENKIVFIAPTVEKHDPDRSRQHIHPYIFRIASNTDVEGLAGATVMARWKDVKTVATIAPDYAYGRDSIAAFIAALKKLRPDIQIVDQQWPKLGEPDFTAFITAQMSKKPDAVYCSLFAGDFVTFTKEATPRGYFKAINNRLIDGAEVGTPDEAQALGNDYPYGIIGNAYDPVIWGGNEPPAHKKFIEDLKAFTHSRIRLGLVDRRLSDRSTRWPRASRRPATPRVGRRCQGAARPQLRHSGRRAELQRQVARDFCPGILGRDGQRGGLSVRHHQGSGSAAGVVPADELTAGQREGVARDPPIGASGAVPRRAAERCRHRFLFSQFMGGLTTAMFLFLIASGLSLVFGVMRVINFAHGSFYMLGAYLAWQGVHGCMPTGGGFWLADLFAALGVGLLGALTERLFFRSLYGREELYQLLCSPMRWC